MRRSLPAFAALALVLSLDACDILYHVSTVVPTAAPLDPACVQPSWDVALVARRDIGMHHDTVYGASMTYLASRINRLNQWFTAEEEDRIVTDLSGRLLDIRARCAGPAGAGEAMYSAEASAPPYRAWTVRGTDGRVLMRLRGEILHHFGIMVTSVGRYALDVDTLATGTDLRHPQWVSAHHVALPSPPKRATFATECAIGFADPDGDLVSLVRNADKPMLTKVLASWRLDRSTFRIRDADTTGVRCRNPHWYVALPSAPPRLQASALTFRPSSGFARVYVFMDGFAYDGEALPPIDVDGRVVGRLEPGSFLMLDLESGRQYAIRSTAEHGRAVLLTPAGDSTYFVELAWRKWAWKRNADAKLVPADRGKASVASGRMVPSSWPPATGSR